MATCRSCEAPIFWARTAKGKAMPVNTKPDPNGKLVVRNEECRWAKPTDPAGLRYTSHYATCTYPDRHRKR